MDTWLGHAGAGLFFSFLRAVLKTTFTYLLLDALGLHCCSLRCQASCGAGFPCGARPPRACASGFTAALPGFEHSLSRYGTPASLRCSMWNLPRPGVRHVSPASAGRFLTALSHQGNARWIPPKPSCFPLATPRIKQISYPGNASLKAVTEGTHLEQPFLPLETVFSERAATVFLSPSHAALEPPHAHRKGAICVHFPEAGSGLHDPSRAQGGPALRLLRLVCKRPGTPSPGALALAA